MCVEWLPYRTFSIASARVARSSEVHIRHAEHHARWRSIFFSSCPPNLRRNPNPLPTSNAQLRRQTASLWPAAPGSLELSRWSLHRRNCPACLTGEKHPGYVLYGREQGRRFSVYVPEELVPQVQVWPDQLLSERANKRDVSALRRRVVRSHLTYLQIPDLLGFLRHRTWRCMALLRTFESHPLWRVLRVAGF